MQTESIDLRVGEATYPAQVTVPEDAGDHGVVLLPGAGHGPYGDVFDRLAGALGDRGLPLLRYESWGDGDDLPDLAAKTDDELFAEYDAAVARLRERGCTRVSVVAKSFGGRLALRHVPDGVDALVLWAPAVFVDGGSAVDLMEFPEGAEPSVITPGTLAERDLPVDVLQGSDDAIPVENAHELAAELPDARVHVVDGADHSFVGGDAEKETVRVSVDALTDRAQ